MKRTPSPPDRHRAAPRFGVARVLSKRGVCSRTQAQALVRAGRVAVNGRVILDPEFPLDADAAITLDGKSIAAAEKVYIALNKPRGVVTTANDERDRSTVYDVLRDAGFALDAWIAPVGRLDKASEGLLLLTNDSGWAASLTDPVSHLDKTYHVQIDALPEITLLQKLRTGAMVDGERLAAKSIEILRRGEKNAWLEILLDEGRNRHIRKLLAAHGVGVLRLIRVAIGSLALGDLAKGRWRELSSAEMTALRDASGDHVAK
ncbi:MAG TPA: pseudouridine synthase [Rudaea sp.]|jgi:23S rRNA pseudouridine2605 synthase|nr:pseudouridine synthase [Rudaea sp.]